MTKAEINYKNGKIYKIEPICEHDEGDVYIGSTTKQYLSQRMTAHRKDYKRYKEGKPVGKFMSFNLFDKYGVDNCNIILIVSVEANSKDELLSREAHYIKTVKCVNKNIPMRKEKEYYVDNKEKIQQYRHDNKEKIQQYRHDNKEKMKQYREDHKDKHKQYREDHKDNYKQLHRKWYQDNKEALNQKGLCQCGSVYSQVHKLRHERSKKHIDFIRCLPSSSDPVSEVV
jgi:hypothetical protein